MNLQFWMGTTIGVVVALLILLAIVGFAGSANTAKAKAANDRNFIELQRRNNIGDSQVNALCDISDVLAKQNRLLALDDEWDDSDDEERADKLAEIKRKKESWQAETIRLENELTGLRNDMELIRAIATPPHHENAFTAIAEIARKAGKAGRGE